MPTANRIVTAALALFYRNGFHASGVDLLSAEAGVTKRTLYKYFPSKDDLIESALLLRHEQFIGRVKQHVLAVEAEARPLAYLDFIGDWVAETEFCGCAFINAAAEFAAREQVPHRLADQHKEEIKALLLGLCSAAGAREPAPVADALFLLGEGLIVTSQVQGCSEALVSNAKQAGRLLWDAAL
ncbi:TetR/AcrR family transcriptional regulator [Marinobacterium lutimaris]|uniref:Transcriptional regulator, TetR family n=1 Tax=Marinobacterium lutimaris TaxID=568106 RepID=A0A1H6DGY3_9GAMM|nr:TetR/AcrR family transcriptional regulator [Marinobacterium lutimaris]SEG84490.1 transcriptional regulator, TetR family [Marinobacterium lutimaris]